MSRSGYSYGCDGWELAMWRGVIRSASCGRRGQKFFRDLIAALDAMPDKRLVANELATPEGEVCALGALGKHRGVAVAELDTYEYDTLGTIFDIAHQLAQETMWVNDDGGPYGGETPEQRWTRVRAWADDNLSKATS